MCSEKPGLGIEVNEELAAKYPSVRSALRPPMGPPPRLGWHYTKTVAALNIECHDSRQCHIRGSSSERNRPTGRRRRDLFIVALPFRPALWRVLYHLDKRPSERSRAACMSRGLGASLSLKIWQERIGKVADLFGRKPVWKMLDDDAKKRPSSWKGAPFLYLFTHAFDWISPVCRGDGEAPIPVCLLPVSFEQKEQLYFWQRSYYHHDNIWLGSGALEVGAYRQLAVPDSELAQHGRDLCREIETATGVPTFYYLMRFWGRPKGENERPCPRCGSDWKIANRRRSRDDSGNLTSSVTVAGWFHIWVFPQTAVGIPDWRIPSKERKAGAAAIAAPPNNCPVMETAN